MNKELIVFDCFGVICSEVFPIWGTRYFSEEEMKNVRKDIIEKSDIGIITEKELFSKLSEITGEDSKKILNDWLKTAVINIDMINLIKELKRKYKISLLSNASSGFINRILKRININELFDCIVISSEKRMIKPNKEIFKLMLSKMKVEASASVFIDDNAFNIQKARESGMTGILFQNIEQLKKDLSNILI